MNGSKQSGPKKGRARTSLVGKSEPSKQSGPTKRRRKKRAEKQGDPNRGLAECRKSLLSIASWWARSDPSQHSRWYRDGRGVAQISIPTSWWPQIGSRQHSRFYRGRRGVAEAVSIFISVVAAAEWP